MPNFRSPLSVDSREAIFVRSRRRSSAGQAVQPHYPAAPRPSIATPPTYILARLGEQKLHVRARHPSRAACLLPGVGWSPTRPAPVDCSFKGPAKNQNDENEKGTQHNDLPLGDGASCADTRGHPDTGSCGQPMDVLTFAISDNDACAQKPDSGHDTLDNAARVGAAAILDR